MNRIDLLSAKDLFVRAIMFRKRFAGRQSNVLAAAFVLTILTLAAIFMADSSKAGSGPVPVIVNAPVATVSPAAVFYLPVTVTDLTGLNVLSYQFDLRFDPSVVQLQPTTLDASGTLSSGMFIIWNEPTPGRLLGSAYRATPLSGSGTLIKIGFTAVGPIGSVSPLHWESFFFNETIPDDLSIDGSITIDVTPEIQFSASSYIDDEPQSATIRVERTGSSSGVSSVDLTMADGTAVGGAACTSGVDYINTPVTPLNFGIGETVKTVSIPLCGDVLTDPFETVNLGLTNIVGADAGSPTSAVLTINDTANQYRSTTPIEMVSGMSATPYPSTITVSGGPTSIGSMRVSLYDVSHVFPDHIDVLLVSPNGAKYLLMGDTGGPTSIPDPPTVTLTFSDVASQTLPDSASLFTDAFKPTSCETPIADFPAPAPTGSYVEPGCLLSRPVTQSMFGAFGLINSNGNWNLYVRDDAGTLTMVTNGFIAGGWGLEFLPPTSAGVEVSGRVLTSDGRGIRNAVVTMTGADGTKRTAVSSSFGYYRFEGVQAGETVIVSASSRSYRFKPRAVQVFDPITDLDLVGIE
jgi:hypothetical protein